MPSPEDDEEVQVVKENVDKRLEEEEEQFLPREEELREQEVEEEEDRSLSSGRLEHKQSHIVTISCRWSSSLILSALSLLESVLVIRYRSLSASHSSLFLLRLGTARNISPRPGDRVHVLVRRSPTRRSGALASAADSAARFIRRFVESQSYQSRCVCDGIRLSRGGKTAIVHHHKVSKHHFFHIQFPQGDAKVAEIQVETGLSCSTSSGTERGRS